MADIPTHIMIFAAGFGTRMMPLTKDRPKPLVEVAGKTLLDHARDLAADAGLEIVVNAHFKAEQIVDHLNGRDARVLVETPDLLDTGGGLKNALPYLGDGPVAGLNSDAVWKGENPLAQLLAAWDPATMEALLLNVPLKRAFGYTRPGSFVADREGRLSFDQIKGNLAYTGAQILKTDRVRQHPETIFSTRDVWQDMAAEGTLFGAEHSGCWADVGTPEGIAIAEDMLRDV